MRFAVLCDQRLSRPLIDALRTGADGFRLGQVVTVLPKDPSSGNQSSDPVGDSWEDLLIAREIDAVIVDGSSPHLVEGVKQLAAASTPLLFVPRAEQGSTLAYELSLIRDDNQVVLFPLFWHRHDAAVIALRTAIQKGTLGRVQFLQLKRPLHRSSEGVPLEQSEIDAELLSDVDLARWLVGDYNLVTALRTGVSSAGVLMQNVVLSGRSLPEFNWEIHPAPGPAEWQLIVNGESQVARLSRSGESQSWRLEMDNEVVVGNELATARSALAAFAAAAQQQPLARRVAGTDDEWGDLVKCFESIDATHRSVARRRTIELHFEPMSERAIFKTQMTAVGCGLLIATFLLTLCYLGVASLVPLPTTVLIGLRMLVFAPLVLFLIAQILLPLTRPSSAERQSAASNSEL